MFVNGIGLTSFDAYIFMHLLTGKSSTWYIYHFIFFILNKENKEKIILMEIPKL